MTVEIVNALLGYFETLYELNRNLIILCGVDVIDNAGQYEKYIREIILDIPRLVPYAFCKKENMYKIDTKDGLLEYSNEIPFLKGDYENILQSHYSLLNNIKKYETSLSIKCTEPRLQPVVAVAVRYLT